MIVHRPLLCTRRSSYRWRVQHVLCPLVSALCSVHTMRHGASSTRIPNIQSASRAFALPLPSFFEEALLRSLLPPSKESLCCVCTRKFQVCYRLPNASLAASLRR